MIEREVKLGAGPAFHLPDLNGVVDGVAVTPPEAVRLETVYYDTPDLRLARWGVSLRHRAGEGWTLKLPPKAWPGAAGGPAARTRRAHVSGRLQEAARSGGGDCACIRAQGGARTGSTPLDGAQAREAGRWRGRAPRRGRRRRGVGEGRPSSGGSVQGDRGRGELAGERLQRHRRHAGHAAARSRCRGAGPDSQAHPRPWSARDGAARGGAAVRSSRTRRPKT